MKIIADAAVAAGGKTTIVNELKKRLRSSQSKIENLSKGYGYQAIMFMLNYGFRHMGLERITANTLDVNIGAQKSLDKCGFVLGGRKRSSVYFNTKMHDRLNYAILGDEFLAKGYDKF